jgi:hypothetical protein
VNLFSLPCSAGSGIRKDRGGSFPPYGSHCEDRAARLCGMALECNTQCILSPGCNSIPITRLGGGGFVFFEAGDEKPGNPSSSHSSSSVRSYPAKETHN